MRTLIRHGIIIFAITFLALSPLSTVPAGLSTAFAQEASVTASTGDTQAAAGAAPSSCSWFNTFSDMPRCVFRKFFNWLGSWVLTFGAAFLLLAGTTFDYFLNNLVVNFGQTIKNMNILPGIQQGWQLFRDVMNIAIIGVFVFVAIMTILGSAEYGAKRLVARVLIVAILINFSLLFSRIIVEGTNFVSGQFARAMPGYTKEKGPSTAESFLVAFGIEDWWNTSSITANAAEKSDSTTMGFFYGAVGGIALFGVGIVLLYGAFVMVARALLLIFMMLTSSIAFASFLIPKWANQNYIGWNSWWSNLLKAAMFGPLLMIFLWVSMTIVQQAGKVANVGEGIRAVAENPATASANAWTGIILLLIGTGLLFIAIRSASSFAASIGGFNWASLAALAPVTLGSRLLAAPLGRRFVGQPALERQLQLEEEIRHAKRNNNFALAAQLQKDYLKATKTASRDFNLMNNNQAKWIASKLGASGVMLGEKKLGGAAGIATAAAKEAAKELKNLQPTGKEIATAGAEAAKQVHEDNKSVLESLKGDRDALVSRRDALANQGPEKTTHVEQDKLLKEMRQTISQATSGSAAIENKAAQHEREVRAQHKSEIDSVTAKISDARTDINDKLKWAQGDVVNANNRLAMKQYEVAQKAAEAAKEAEGQMEDTMNKAIRDALPWSRRNASTVKITAKELGNMQVSENVKKHMSDMIDQNAKPNKDYGKAA